MITRVPQADHSIDHHAYRCYRRGPDGFRELSICEPGARREATQPEGAKSTRINVRLRQCAKHP